MWGGLVLETFKKGQIAALVNTSKAPTLDLLTTTSLDKVNNNASGMEQEYKMKTQHDFSCILKKEKKKSPGKED